MADKAPNQNVAMVRNIIVGVSTSVIGAASLYFLGINKSGSSSASSQGSFLEVKEATTKGWKEYIADDNIYYKNTSTITKGLQQDMNFGSYKTGILREMHKFQDDLNTIQKEDNLDKTFVTLLKRRLDLEKEIEEILPGHLDKFKNIMDGNDANKQQQLQQAYTKFMSDARSITERSVTEAEGLVKALNDKYGQLFDLNESLAYKDYKSGNNYSTNTNTGANPNTTSPRTNIPAAPANSTVPAQNTANNNTNNGQSSAGMFAGDWSNEAGILHLDNNGFSWRWNDGNPTSSGGWRAQNNQIAFYVTNGYSANTTQVFNIYNVTSNSFTIQLASNPSIVYNCVKR